MVRAPCCEKSGLKKGPWTAEEDRILVAFITHNGHDNWRALPKQAGLLRCGKSCRLRWMNYLRPDIKRGNFTREEEELIIKLHAELGNKWSAIVARLPGRTDNEIKNVWHTHLKKRVAGKPGNVIGKAEYSSDCEPKVEKYSEQASPSSSLSEVSSITTAGAGYGDSDIADDYVMEDLFDMLAETGNGFWPEAFPTEEWSSGGSNLSAEEGFWSEILTAEEWSGDSDPSAGESVSQLQFAGPVQPRKTGPVVDGFWQEVFNRAEELTKYI